MPFPSPTSIEQIWGAVRDEFLSFYAQLEGWLRKQHKADGSHGAITADSLTATGAVTADGAGTFDGNVTADADGEVVVIGDMTTPAAAAGAGISMNEGTSHWAFIADLGTMSASPALLINDVPNRFTAAQAAILYRPSALNDIPAVYRLIPGSSTVNLDIGENTSNRRINDVNAKGEIYERSRTTAMGEWITPAFSAGNFTGNGAMTWTVAAGDVTTYTYRLVGKSMTVSFYIVSTTVGGTLNTTLQIAIPGGFTAAKTMLAGVLLYQDAGGGNTHGFIQVSSSGTVLQLFKDNSANWSAATDTTAVFGEIEFEVQ